MTPTRARHRARAAAILVTALVLGSLSTACTSAPPRTTPGPSARTVSTTSASASPSTPASAPGPGGRTPTSSPPAPGPGSTIASGSLRPSGSVQVLDCKGGQPSSFPVILILACADGGITVADIVWATWTATSARGTGTLRENNCRPTCAQGTFVNHPATIALSAPVPFDGTTLFTRASIRSSDASVAPIDQVLPN